MWTTFGFRRCRALRLRDRPRRWFPSPSRWFAPLYAAAPPRRHLLSFFARLAGSLHHVQRKARHAHGVIRGKAVLHNIATNHVGVPYGLNLRRGGGGQKQGGSAPKLAGAQAPALGERVVTIAVRMECGSGAVASLHKCAGVARACRLMVTTLRARAKSVRAARLEQVPLCGDGVEHAVQPVQHVHDLVRLQRSADVRETHDVAAARAGSARQPRGRAMQGGRFAALFVAEQAKVEP